MGTCVQPIDLGLEPLDQRQSLVACCFEAANHQVRHGYDESVIDFLAAVPLTADHVVHDVPRPGRSGARRWSE